MPTEFLSGGDAVVIPKRGEQQINTKVHDGGPSAVAQSFDGDYTPQQVPGIIDQGPARFQIKAGQFSSGYATSKQCGGDRLGIIIHRWDQIRTLKVGAF